MHRRVAMEVDIRPILAEGRSPLPLVLNSLDVLEPGQHLKVVSPFKPEPLIRLVELNGYRTEAEPDEDGRAWSVWIRSGR